MFTGISYFQELALYFKKHGYYPYQDEYNKIFKEINKSNKNKNKFPVTYDMMSYNMQEFTNYYINMLVNGDSHGDVHLTGEHLFYLNCTKIQKVNDITGKKGRRAMDFPDFWDEDWRYYWSCYIAEFGLEDGIELEQYKKLCKPMDIGLIEDLDNLQGGLDVAWFKPRGVGASWKGGAKSAYNMVTRKDSNTFILAEKEAYLKGDGILDKFDTIRSFVQDNCWWLKKQYTVESMSNFLFSTGYKDASTGSNITKGFNSNLIGITIDGDPDKARGKRGDMLYEELGSFESAEACWGVTEASVNEGGIIYGQRRAFGTGGDKGGHFELMEKMAENPKSFRLIRFKYNDGGFEKEAPFFTLRETNVGHKDINGNSNTVTAETYFETVYQKLLNDGQVDRAIRYLAEFPRRISDMFLDTNVDYLPKGLAKNALDFLTTTNIDRQLSKYGTCEYYTTNAGIGNVRFVEQPVLPFEDYPIKKGQNHLKKGCVQIVHQPIKINGVIPDDIYLLVVDAYTQESGNDTDSIGSVKIYEQPNKFTSYKGDMFVAYYDDRPFETDGLNKFAGMVYKLAELYNAKIGLENDQVGDIVSYGKSNRDSKGRRLTKYLAEQFDLGFDEKIMTKKSMRRQFGMNMTNARKMQGLKYYNDWLIKERGKNVLGKPILNIDTIMSRGELKEISKFKLGQNADRISSSVIAMYHSKEATANFIKKNWGTKDISVILNDLKLY